MQFFNLADKALMKHMDRDIPVVLAGVEYLLPRYKETTELPHVLDEGLTGNAEGLSPEELRDKAWEIVEPVLNADPEQGGGALRRFPRHRPRLQPLRRDPAGGPRRADRHPLRGPRRPSLGGL